MRDCFSGLLMFDQGSFLEAVWKIRRFSRRPVNSQGQLDQVPQPLPLQLVLLGKDLEVEEPAVPVQSCGQGRDKIPGQTRRDVFFKEKPEVIIYIDVTRAHAYLSIIAVMLEVS